jgi:hypothetical protein
MPTDRVVARQGPSGSWYYVEIANNNEITGTSETYSSKQAAEKSGQNKADELGVEFIVEEPNGG